MGGINAGAGAPRAVGRLAVEIEKVPLGLGAADEFGAGVVLAVIVVVPRAENAGALAKQTVAGEVVLTGVVMGQAVERNAGAGLGSRSDRARRVGVDGVAEPDPGIGETVDHGIPDWGGIERRVARPEGEAPDKRARLGWGVVGTERTGGERGGEDDQGQAEGHVGARM